MTWERSGLDVGLRESAPPLSDTVLEKALDCIGLRTPTGVCVACEATQFPVQHYEEGLKCQKCGRLTVYGAEKILVYDGTREGGTL